MAACGDDGLVAAGNRPDRARHVGACRALGRVRPLPRAARFRRVAIDHIGHGKSARDPRIKGICPSRAGADILVEDVGSMRSVMGSPASRRSVPYFIFGHSMGKLRRAQLSDEIRCGAVGRHHLRHGQQASHGGSVREAPCALHLRKKGERFVSPFLRSLADGAYSKAVRNARTPFDWLSYDEANVDAYIADEMCGCPFTVGAYASLSISSSVPEGSDLAMNVPKSLPMFYIAGAEDPVGPSATACATPSRSCAPPASATSRSSCTRGCATRSSTRPTGNQVFEDVLAWLEGHGARRA